MVPISAAKAGSAASQSHFRELGDTWCFTTPMSYEVSGHDKPFFCQPYTFVDPCLHLSLESSSGSSSSRSTNPLQFSYKQVAGNTATRRFDRNHISYVCEPPWDQPSPRVAFPKRILTASIERYFVLKAGWGLHALEVLELLRDNF